jgi:anthranilate synthase/indole-3-glycerol phosphate synthase/phosphoribosylanthranilate isomerase
MTGTSSANSHQRSLKASDSFTHNLYQYLALLGAPVSIYRTREITLNEIDAKHPKLTHLVISPGPGHPLRDSGISIEAIKHYAGKVPILGVCMGLQCIFAAYGGSVDGAGEIIHGKTSAIVHDGKGLFRQIPQGVRATRYHSLAGAIESLPDVLEITSRTKQGEPGEKGGIVMGVRHKEFTIESVQYHPESILSEYGQEMFANFVALRGGKWTDNPSAGVSGAADGKSTAKVDAAAVPTILETIAKQRLVDVAKAKATPGSAPHDLESLISLHVPPPLVPFHARVLPPKVGSSHPHVALMAEVKRASPSKGDFLPAHSPLSAPGIALEYALAGASVISVLTEPKWFKGSLEDLRAVRAAVDSLPNRPCILRKDFVLDTYQIDEARVYGADTVLLIVAILDDLQLRTLYAHARRRGMEPLVEVNNAAELDRALALGARVIGVNNRNLHDFEVDMATTSRMAEALRQRAQDGHEVVLCALSGIAGRSDVDRYVTQGVGAVLVGEALMRATDKGAFVRQLLGPSAPPAARSAASSKSPPDGLAPNGTDEPEPPLVKICGIKTEEVALATADAGADFIGLMFHAPSKRNVSIASAARIVNAVRSRSLPSTNGHSSEPDEEPPSSWFDLQTSRLRRHPRRPLFVGVFQNASLAAVLHTIDAVGLDLVQLHGDEPLGWTRLLPVPVIKAFHVSSSLTTETDLADVARPGYHALPLLDTAVAGKLSGGAGKAFDWSIARRYVDLGAPVVLAGGLDHANVAKAVREVRPFAVDVSGGVETNGEKDVDRIRAFVAAAKGLSRAE